jgi:transcriptional regulator with XRE-family HTH domain
MTIGSIIKPLLKERKLTQTDLGKRIGVSRQQVNEILKRAELSDDIVEKIEDALDSKGVLEMFRCSKINTQTAYGFVVIQNQQANDALIKSLQERVEEQSNTIKFLQNLIYNRHKNDT